eukprot:Hpha_TRINITY_DN19285_c0_g1::TRINITY_DN19285_c0_g1_i1::g.194425::m.194425
MAHPRAARFVTGAGPRVPEPVGRGDVLVPVRPLLDGDAVHLSGVEGITFLAPRPARPGIRSVRHGTFAAGVEGAGRCTDVPSVRRDERLGGGCPDFGVDTLPQIGGVGALRHGVCTVEPEAVDRTVLRENLLKHAELAVYEGLRREVLDLDAMPVVLHVQVVANLDAPPVRRVSEFTQHVSSPVPPPGGCHRVLRVLRGPQREPPLVLGSKANLLHPHGFAIAHPVVAVQVRRVEHIRVQTWVVSRRLVGVVDGGCAAVVVGRVRPVKIFLRRVPKGVNAKVEELNHLLLHEVKLPLVGQRHRRRRRRSSQQCQCSHAYLLMYLAN